MTQLNQKGVRDMVQHGLRTGMAWFMVWTYTAMAPFGWAFFACLCFLWRKDPHLRAVRLQRVQTRAYRFMHSWLRWSGITNFDHRRPIGGLPDGPSVVIANHPTLMDITSITAVVGSGCTIIKPAMFNRRLLHGLLVGAGHIEGPGADVLSIGRILEDAVDRLQQGFTIIVFPEGTRSRGSKLLPFGRTPFEIACRAGVPLVSMTVQCDPVYLSKEVPVLRPPHPVPELRLGVLAIDYPRSEGLGSRELRKKVEARYHAWIEKPAKASVSSP